MAVQERVRVGVPSHQAPDVQTVNPDLDVVTMAVKVPETWAMCERHAGVGTRFHGDFRGLENWSTEHDVLEEVHGVGVEPTFEHLSDGTRR